MKEAVLIILILNLIFFKLKWDLDNYVNIFKDLF